MRTRSSRNLCSYRWTRPRRRTQPRRRTHAGRCMQSRWWFYSCSQGALTQNGSCRILGQAIGRSLFRLGRLLQIRIGQLTHIFGLKVCRGSFGIGTGRGWRIVPLELGVKVVPKVRFHFWFQRRLLLSRQFVLYGRHAAFGGSLGFLSPCFASRSGRTRSRGPCRNGRSPRRSSRGGIIVRAGQRHGTSTLIDRAGPTHVSRRAAARYRRGRLARSDWLLLLLLLRGGSRIWIRSDDRSRTKEGSQASNARVAGLGFHGGSGFAAGRLRALPLTRAMRKAWTGASGTSGLQGILLFVAQETLIVVITPRGAGSAPFGGFLKGRDKL